MMRRIFYAAGPGDAIASFDHWKKREYVVAEGKNTYSGQFFDFCKETGDKCYVVTSNANADSIEEGNFLIENRPKKPRGNLGGIRYHLREIFYGLSLLYSALKFRADIVLADSGSTHWFVLPLAKLWGAKIVISLHNNLWPAGFKSKKRVNRWIYFLDSLFFKHFLSSALCVSKEGMRQIRELGGDSFDCVVYLPIFSKTLYAATMTQVSDDCDWPFRILYSGRVEGDKGIFDLIEIARLVEKAIPGKTVFDVCGQGSDFEQAVNLVGEAGLGHVVHFQGMQSPANLVSFYRKSHLVIVPTTSRFPEGFCTVVAEAILCDTPVISSTVVPACEMLPGAVQLVGVDDVKAYAEKIIELATDRSKWRELQSACKTYRGELLDHHSGFDAALRQVLG